MHQHPHRAPRSRGPGSLAGRRAGRALDPQVVKAALVFALDTGSAARRQDLRTELARIEPELARYADAIADAGPLDTILQAIKVREERRDTIRQELRVFALQRPGEPDAKEIRQTLAGYLADWTALTVARERGRPRNLRPWFAGFAEGWRTDPGRRRPR